MSDDILNKIKKLVRLSESSNPNEAASAMAKAQAMLQQHNLEMSDLGAIGEDKDEVGNDVFSYGLRRVSWKEKLAGVIARNNFCGNLIGKGYIRFIGHKRDLAVVEWMFKDVSARLEVLSREDFKRWKKDNPYESVHGKHWMNAYLFGAVNGIATRFHEQKKAFEAAQSAKGNTGMALMIVKSEAIDRYIKMTYQNLGTARIGYSYHSAASAMGKQAGYNLSMNRGYLK